MRGDTQPVFLQKVTQQLLESGGALRPVNHVRSRVSWCDCPPSSAKMGAYRRSPTSPLDQHYVRLREELNRTFETIGLAPA